MANNPKISAAAAGDLLNGAASFIGLFNTGTIKIYSGAQPAGPSVAVPGPSVLLSTLTFGATAFGAPSAGVSTANAITADNNAAGMGTATWARCLKSDGTTAVMDCSVGTSGADINLNSVAIVIGANVSISSFTIAFNSIVG